jgi:hypothetical protein
MINSKLFKSGISFFSKNNFRLSPSKKFFFPNQKKLFGFLRPEKPWIKTAEADELPPKDETFEHHMGSKKTYTKYFNPIMFDPRTPDYFETVRGTWDQQPTREDFGEGIFFIK